MADWELRYWPEDEQAYWCHEGSECNDRCLDETLDSFLPCGVALCTVDLTDCRPMTKDDIGAAYCDIYPGAFAWILSNVRPIEKPFPVKGQLGIFEVTV